MAGYAPGRNGAGNSAEAVSKIKKLRLMTALKTPYKPDGDIDMAALDRLVEEQVQGGVEALIMGGTTGEGHLLSWDEHLYLIAHVKARFPSLCIVGNTGSNSTAESVYATKKGFALGMDCSLLINPYYGKTSRVGIIKHIEAAMQYGPAIIYNVPGRTGQDIPPDIIYELAKHENFVGVKECMGNDRIKELSDKGLACWSGNDDQCYECRHKYGGVGVISVTSNVVPALFHKLMHGAPDDAVNDKLKPLYGWLFAEPNPIGVNTMLMMMGKSQPVFRLPYVQRNREARQEGVKIMQAILGDAAAAVRAMEDDEFVHLLSGD